MLMCLISKDLEDSMIYDNLIKMLQKKGLKKFDLTNLLRISSMTVVKIGRGKKADTDF